MTLAPVETLAEVEPAQEEELDHYVCCQTKLGETTLTLCGLPGKADDLVAGPVLPDRACVVCTSLAQTHYCPLTGSRCTVLL